MSAIGFEDHDHTTCVGTALTSAEDICARRNLKFTKIRRRVLEILLRKHSLWAPMISLICLRSEGLPSQPPVAYRALDFLVANVLAHKLEKRAAYIACSNPGTPRSPAFMICRRCNRVVETSASHPPRILDQAA